MPSRSRRLAQAIVWAGSTAWLLPAFAPGTTGVGLFSSDSAIPLLKANARVYTAFHLYLFGQDRIGGWPFILAWLVHRVFRVNWSVAAFYWLQGVTLLSAVPALVWLGGGAGELVGAAFLVACVLNPAASWWLFDLAPPFSWQLAAIVLAWCALRIAAAPGPRRVLRLGLAAITCYLAIWTSPLSAMVLLPAAISEALRASPPPGRHSRVMHLGLTIVPVVLACVGERLTAYAHSLYAARHGLWFQTTTFQLDMAHLGANVAGIAGALGATRWWVVAPVSTVSMVALLLRQRRDAFREPAAVIALGCWVGATGMALACVATEWVRLNGYAPRYLAPLHVLWAVSLAASVGLLLPAAVRTGLALTLVGLAVGLRPAPTVRPEFVQLQHVAEQLGQRAHGIPLLGDYRSTSQQRVTRCVASAWFACRAPPPTRAPKSTWASRSRPSWCRSYCERITTL